MNAVYRHINLSYLQEAGMHQINTYIPGPGMYESAIWRACDCLRMNGKPFVLDDVVKLARIEHMHLTEDMIKEEWMAWTSFHGQMANALHLAIKNWKPMK